MRSAVLPFLVSTAFSLALPQDWSAQAQGGLTYGDVTQKCNETITAAWYDPYTSKSGAPAPADPASVYTCVGPNMYDYPKKSEWISFEDMWTINAPQIKKKNQVGDYNQHIKAAIEDISTKSKIDARLILALIMQESWGEVKVGCTPGVAACGLMQFIGGSGFQASDPAGSIHQMISDAVYGVQGKPGFLHRFRGGSPDLSWTDSVYWGNPYAAVRQYNGGLITSPELNVPQEGNEITQTYANDIASRLLGWNGWPAGCRKSVEDPKCAAMHLRASTEVCGTWA